MDQRPIWGHERLRKLIALYAERPFWAVIPGGNYGDHLIWRGGEKLLRECGVDFRTLSFDEYLAEPPDGDVVVYIHGHGGFVPWWGDLGERLLRHACAVHPGVLIQGPSTIHADPAYATGALSCVESAICSSVHVFAREHVSHAIMVERLGDEVVSLDHDTAFALVGSDFPEIERLQAGRRDYLLLATREDKESAVMWSGWSLDPAIVAKSFEHWLAMHACAREIVTNRLHSAIAGVVFGVPTSILPSSYHKPRSVWEMSLRERGVEWLDRPPQDERRWASAMSAIGRLSPRLRASLIGRYLLRIRPDQLRL